MAAADITASSSSIAINLEPEKYEVFISFSGGDVRHRFLSHLFAALDGKQIHVFIDDDMERGEDITDAILQTIEQSNLSLVIFSENYPKSQWCLEELEKIHECLKQRKQIVLPVFYQIDPSKVQLLEGNYAVQVEKWRHALVDISNLAGFHSGNRNFKNEIELLDAIANKASMKLDELYARSSVTIASFGSDSSLFGIDSSVEDVESELHIESTNDVSMVGIWGMGGIGKTTIAAKVFNKVRSNFNGHCFVSNLRETLTTKCGINDLRERIIRELLRDESIKINSPQVDIDPIKRRLKRKRALIVLDDVDTSMQLKSLLEDGDLYTSGSLCPGSRIIITSRDSKVFENVEMKKFVYPVKQLEDDEALQLFCWHAFGQINPLEGYQKLSGNVVQYACGVPLALVVLGSELKNKTTRYWEDALRKFDTNTPLEIQKILRESYYGLGKDEKSIFLDIACFFKGCRRSYVEKVLESFGFHSEAGIDRLIEKSLITQGGAKINMHDLLQQMGHEILEDEKQTHQLKSRLWTYDDIVDALTNDMGTENVEGICLKWKMIDDGFPVDVSPKAFIRMRRLRFLQIEFKVSLLDGLDFLPNSLRYLLWDDYLLECLPFNVNPDKLVELHMVGSQLKQLLWNKPLKKLKHIDLSFSYKLTRICDLAKAPNLEILNLKGCSSLVEIGSSIENLCKLTKLDLSGCTSLAEIGSSLVNLNELRELYLSWCESLSHLPEIPCSIQVLDVRNTGIRKLPARIHPLICFGILKLESCKKLESLPGSIGDCRIKELVLVDCGITELPSTICHLTHLELLRLESCKNLKSLPISISNLTSLRRLCLSKCSNLNNLPELWNMEFLEELDVSGSGLKQLPFSFKQLKRLNCSGCSGLQLPLFFCPNLSHINLSDCDLSEFPEQLCSLKSLMKIELRGNNFKSIPASIEHLSALFELDLTDCRHLASLPHLPLSLYVLLATNCTSLEALPAPFSFPRYFLGLFNCSKLQLVASSIMEQYRQKTCFLSFNQRHKLCISGSDVPEWMKYRNCSGSSLSLELPNLGRGINVIFCAVMPAIAHSLNFLHQSVVALVTHERGVTRYHFSSSDHFESKVKNKDDLNVFLWNRHVLHTYIKEVSFEFQQSWNTGTNEMIIKCGVHPICVVSCVGIDAVEVNFSCPHGMPERKMEACLG